MNLYLILIAVILDLIIGDPKKFPHLIRFIGKTISFYSNKLFAKKTFLAGFWLFLLTQITIIILYLLIRQLLSFNIVALNIFYIIIIFYCISIKSLYEESLKVYNKLKYDTINNARKQLSQIVGRNTENLNKNQICQAVIETVAENISDGIIAPLFYIFLFGPIGGVIYKTANTLDSMVGYKDEKYYKIGYVSAKFDDVVNYIPARLTTGIILIISIFYKKYKQTFNTIIKYHNKHSSPNAGWSESAVSGLLGIKLGGANYYFNKLVIKPEIGKNFYFPKLYHIKEVNKIIFYSLEINLIFLLTFKFFDLQFFWI